MRLKFGTERVICQTTKNESFSVIIMLCLCNCIWKRMLIYTNMYLVNNQILLIALSDTWFDIQANQNSDIRIPGLRIHGVIEVG